MPDQTERSVKKSPGKFFRYISVADEKSTSFKPFCYFSKQPTGEPTYKNNQLDVNTFLERY